MQMAVVKGRATSTVKHPSFDGLKLLICQPLGSQGQANGDPVLAIDQLGAGYGDRVMISSDGRGLREMIKAPSSPARWWVQGIIDE